MFKRYGLLCFALLFLSVFVLNGCVLSDILNEEEVVPEETISREQKENYEKNQPNDKFEYSMLLDLLQKFQIEINQKDAYTWTQILNEDGTVHEEFPSLSFPVPLGTRTTNSLQSENGMGDVVDKSELNGIFASKNSIHNAFIYWKLNPDKTVSPIVRSQGMRVVSDSLKLVDGVWVKTGVPSIKLKPIETVRSKD